MHGQIAYVVRNIQLALESVAEQPQVFQIDKVAEFLGQFSCKQVKMSANRQRMNDGTYNRTCEAIELQHELFQIDEVA